MGRTFLVKIVMCPQSYTSSYSCHFVLKIIFHFYGKRKRTKTGCQLFSETHQIIKHGVRMVQNKRVFRGNHSSRRIEDN